MASRYDIIRPSSRQEWLTERAKGIGSSEIATIMGVNPWQTPYQLWERKVGAAAEEQDSPILRAGHMLEEVVAKYYAEDARKHVIKSSAGDWVAVDKDCPILRVSPDRLYFLKGLGGERGVLECKTTSKGIDKDDIPMNYFCQLQYQMGILGLQRGTLAWLERGVTFDYQEFDFDSDLFDLMRCKAVEWWKTYVEGNTPPPPISAKDVIAIHPDSKDAEAVATDETLGDVMRLKDINAELKALTAEADAIKDRLACAFGEAERLVTEDKEGGRSLLATYKSQTTRRLDTSRIKDRYPSMYEALSKPTTTRVLRLK